MLRVILDTSVCVSALLSNSGASSRIVRDVLSGQLQSITTEEILDEVRGVLGRSKFRLSTEKQHAFVRLLTEVSLLLVPANEFLVKRCRDPQDDMFLSLAKQSKADFLVSLDQDLLELGKIGVTKIVKPGDFLKEVAGLY